MGARPYTPIPNEWLEEMGELDDAEYGRLIRWCQSYNITGETEKLDGNERFYLKRCANAINRFNEKYEESDTRKSEAGKVAANARWHKNVSEGMRTHADVCDDVPKMPTKAKAYTNTKTKSNSNNNIKASETPLDRALDDFAKARKAMRKPLTDKARELTVRDLEKLAPGDEATQIAILNQSIQRGWQGVFPLREEKPAKGLPKEVKPLLGGDDLDRLERLLGNEAGN